MATAADQQREYFEKYGVKNGDYSSFYLGNMIADIFDGRDPNNPDDNDLGDLIADTFTNAKDAFNNAKDDVAEIVNTIGDNFASVKDKASKFIGDLLHGSDASSIGGNQGQLSMVNSAQDVNYINADLAKAYGMDASTAYQEALSNTAYQRAVQDAKNAGLNPALMFSSGSSASSFSGTLANGNVGSSAKAQSNLDFSAIGSVVGAIAGLLIGQNASSLYAGKSIGGAIGSVVEGFTE